MDRISWIGLILCVSLLFIWSSNSAKRRVLYEEKNKNILTKKELSSKLKNNKSTESKTNIDRDFIISNSGNIIKNEELTLHITSKGAGIRLAELNNHKRKSKKYNLVPINEYSSYGIGFLLDGNQKNDYKEWKILDSSRDGISFQRTFPSGIKIRKKFYFLKKELDPHEVYLDLTLENPSNNALIFKDKYLYAGSASPLHLDEWSMQVGMFWFNQGKKFSYKTTDHFGGNKFLGIFGKDEIQYDIFNVDSMSWAGVNNQFFTTIIQPQKPYSAKLLGSRFPVVVGNDRAASERKRMFASELSLSIPQTSLNPNESKKFKYKIYLGPKEFSRLNSLGDKKNLVMHYDEIPIFGFLFGWAIKPLASFLIVSLVAVKGIVGNYGLAIIIVTLFIRLIIWPVYAKSSRSMKKMSKLSPMMKEIKDKYGDDPQKVNLKTMELYRSYKINPLGGCLPMFIQLPVFLAFYRMLWSAVELRNESFLWVSDLSMPDTLFNIPGLNMPFNLLPILMGLTSFIQMAITPKSGDKTQQMVFMFMPVIFLFICYNFASALSLYWTISNVFSIFQTWIMNKLPEPELKKVEGSSKKKSFFQKIQEQAEEAQRLRSGGNSSTNNNFKKSNKLPSDKGSRHTKKKKR